MYPEDFEHKVGFDAVRQLLKEKCISEPGIEFVDEISFSDNFDAVSMSLNQTSEFCQILAEENDFSMGNIVDIRNGLKKIRVEGLFLDEQELNGLRTSLETFSQLLKFFNNADETRYFHLRQLFIDAENVDNILREINRILDKYGKIKDNASAQLFAIRREMTSVQGSISRILQSVLRKAQTDGYVEKDLSPVMRDGRLVIPVNPSYKRHIKGIVLDESATGKTVFIEPTEAVEANNRLRELNGEERREIIKILTEFSTFLRPYTEEILHLFEILGEIDMIRAKALFATEINAVLPQITSQTEFEWHGACHPLLYLSHKKQGKKVVPLNIKLNDENRILLISGPNAGGKSVCLKTVGLLQYMLQCGLLVPMSESSKTGIFTDIFIDIGDEQSIEDDLSTYSSHLKNMKYFLRNCNEKSIILIDEFGSGTEPRIGGAIAEVLLKQFNEKRTYGVVTTHYTNLKLFAENTDGVANGAMLYNRHEMQPLFELQIGIPGSSFAVEIARKIGLPEDIISEASEKAGNENVKLDKYLQDAIRDKHYWETKRKTIRQKEKYFEEMAEKYRAELENIEKQRKELLRNAKSEAKSMIENANAQIENTIRKIKESKADKEQTKSARNDLKEFSSELQQKEESLASLSKKIEKIAVKKHDKPKQKQQFDPKNYAVGDNVRLKGQNTIGVILDIQGKNATVAFGQLKMNAKLENLEKLSNNQVKKEQRQITLIGATTREEIRQKKLNFKHEIDVRGMRGDEALQAVMYFIDDALTVGVSEVRILHGTGTGALREVIRQYLATVNGVERYHDEHVQFGGAGITVVEF